MDLDSLRFRRQFAVGPRVILPTSSWLAKDLLYGLKISIHRDLHLAMCANDRVAVALLGTVVHAREPSLETVDLVRELFDKAGEPAALWSGLDMLAGRWIIIVQSNGRTWLQADACGCRSVFYARVGDAQWAASQPALLDSFLHLAIDQAADLAEFQQSAAYLTQECAWIGDRTIYRDCRRLLPNHRLDLTIGRADRVGPAPFSSELPSGDPVSVSAAMLSSIMEGIALRWPTSMAVTAGLDSRILLAASRRVVKGIHLFVDRMGTLTDDDPDVWVPRELCRRLCLEFTVRNSHEPPPPWFQLLLETNVTGARNLTKTQAIFAKLHAGESALQINGNGGEICRNYFDEYAREQPRDWSTRDMAEMLGHFHRAKYVKDALTTWLGELPAIRRGSWDLRDLLYWEQRMGLWGAQYSAEQDIAIDEISPYSCRALLQVMYAAPRKDRSAPGYAFFVALLRALWPETLHLPINPSPRGNASAAAKRLIRPYVPNSAIRWFRRLAVRRSRRYSPTRT